MKAIIMTLGCLYCSVATAQFFVDKQPAYIQIGKRGVSNREWASFLQFVKDDCTLPKNYGRLMTPTHWSYTQLPSQPVRGVTWKQALAYCEWRSTTVTYLNTHSKLSTYQKMKQANATAKTLITYRLPTDEEFDQLLPSTDNSKEKVGIGFRCVRSVRRPS